MSSVIKSVCDLTKIYFSVEYFATKTFQENNFERKHYCFFQVKEMKLFCSSEGSEINFLSFSKSFSAKEETLKDFQPFEFSNNKAFELFILELVVIVFESKT